MMRSPWSWDTFVGASASNVYTGNPNFGEKGEEDAILKKLFDEFSQKSDKQEDKQAKAKASRSTEMQKKRRNSRKPMGWSIPASSPKQGPLAKCRGCCNQITRSEARVRHHFEDDKNPKFKHLWSYHLDGNCLLNLSKEHKRSFLNKKFSKKKARIVQNLVAKLGDSDSD